MLVDFSTRRNSQPSNQNFYSGMIHYIPFKIDKNSPELSLDSPLFRCFGSYVCAYVW